MKTGIHGKQLDASQAELLMPLAQFVLPARLRRIDRQEANQLVGMSGNIVGHVPVIDPQSAQFRLAPKHDGDGVFWRGLAVFLVAHGQVELRARLGPLGLLSKVVAEMAGIFPGVTMDIENHDRVNFLAGAGTGGRTRHTNRCYGK